MASWFYLELETGPAYELELDTTPPVITWGTPSGALAGSLLSVPYTINEPQILTAKLVDSQGQEMALTVGPANISGLVPAFFYEGTAQIIAHVKDEVYNETFRVLPFQLVGVPVEPGEVEEKEPGGGSRPVGTYGPAFIKEEHRFAAEVSGRKVDFVRIPARVSGSRSQIFPFAGAVSASKSEQFRFPGERAPALELAQLRREEDELLMLL